MTSPQHPGRGIPAPGTAPEQFKARAFDFSRIRGLSPGALELHRSLYETYVKETNALLAELYRPPRAEESPGEALQSDGLVRRFAFEWNGMMLHELFFEALDGTDAPPPAAGIFMEAVDVSFGGYDAWKRDVVRVARTRGVGWVLTFRSENDNRLANVWVDDHRTGLLSGVKPVVAFDLWEHAYLLDFKPADRAGYLQTLFENLNWDVVEARCR